METNTYVAERKRFNNTICYESFSENGEKNPCQMEWMCVVEAPRF